MTPFKLNATHDPLRRSWLDSANTPDTEFPIQNLPLGAFRRADGPVTASSRLGAAIGDQVVDLVLARDGGALGDLPAPLADALGAPSLNTLMALGPKEWSLLRERLSEALRVGSGVQEATAGTLVPLARWEPVLPCVIGDYTDFYASLEHATHVGSMFRPDNPLLPNWKWVPIGYHGRASSIVVTGATIARPRGQTKADDAPGPSVGPTRLLDYECEVGAFVGGENPMGTPVPIGAAHERLFGLCLVNDWSARDIQKWEYQPLGPFLAKSFATTVSPWVVTAEALAPFRGPVRSRAEGDPAPLPYLEHPADRQSGAIDLVVEVLLSSIPMRDQGMPPMLVSRGRFADMYWTLAQLLTHHTSNGCNLRPGDLLASGTISGEEPPTRGCLLERTWRGTKPLTLPTGEERKFLEDGDEVVLRGSCRRPGHVAIGFGECRGIVAGA